ncbi:Iron-binding zinc finger CDGSH type [Candidatus Izimaplasma bacterium HR1]|jgi:CDGSH-type Zn-finger protein|uniref:CDGSH iron-sulfur domain-containing protein n=1 Tax=Candidatus Izimoplasma sp. HR1 TaxID=1541959 RepID=UPI0004F5B782|nr:Iron-binding zinc finger CDGSH type [Candidatus Izimaplasma bacterium HR1]
MSKKKREPIAVELKQNKQYYWCQCGQSDNQPFCDGSHKGYFCEPVMFTVSENITKKLCTCKNTSNPPYCDGTHRKFNAE